ncbi:TlpA family protein disulfide reductase [Polaribacter sp. Asnod6-C07]|uniref:TlpA family protein disulfide reductase n=1 Tax=Polaribacter sp. Asnod6-C07 TaxID=3160582 RepID=UPI00386D809D
MKRTLILLTLLILILDSCSEKSALTLKDVITKFNEKAKTIDIISYQIRKIDTFPSGIWDKKGFALIEKKANDSIFGFSYYAKNKFHNAISIYNEYNHFNIKSDKNEFRQEKAGNYILGSPGGQMVYKDIFELDDIKPNQKLKETDNSYIIIYKLKDIEKYNIINRNKEIEIDKKTFTIKRVHSYSFSEIDNHKKTSTYLFSDIVTNNSVNDNVENHLAELASLDQVLPEKKSPNKLLKKDLPRIELTNLLSNKLETLSSNKLTLIDFWEVWCGYCIKSFPEVEKLNNKYKDLQVIGIVSENKNQAKRLIDKKEVTFTNLIGTKDLLKQFSVTSFPRYFLIDKNGIIQKEYHGFSDEIEKDIKEMI